MALTATQQVTVDAPVEACFGYVDDWRNVPHWLVGVETFTPVGDQDQGLGSVFDVAVHAGIRVRTRLRVTEHVDDRLIAFESVKGFRAANRWTFEPLEERRTLITAETTLHPPFGPAGKAVAKVLEPAVGKIMGTSAQHLKERIEAR